MTGGVWNRETVGWVLAATLLPVLAALMVERGADPLLRVAAGLAVTGLWQALFRAAQGVPHSAAGAVTAVAVAVMAPEDLALWQIILGVSFGTVIGELVFGGWGRNVLGAATVALAFLYLSFPGTTPPPAGATLLIGCAASAVILLATGILSAGVVIAALAAWWGVALALAADPMPAAGSGALAFALVFLLGDPVASSATPAGRWIHGALGGGLAALLAAGAGAVPQAAVFAALLASIAAPLIDQGVIAAARYRRSRRHG